LTNHDLVRHCRHGNAEAQRLLYDRFVASLARLCQRYLHDKDDVEDVLMEGFMKVFKALDTFTYTDENSLEVWMRRIMINECLMRLRKTRKLAVMQPHENTTPHAPETTDTTLSTEEILTLVGTLPEGYRTVFNLYAIDGYSHAEIAAHLGISESASRSQLTHARTRLKELLTRHGWK
jgi:RNA polymerase sigma factor (sigma-70 family)